MKVTFELNAAQLARAEKICADMAAQAEQWEQEDEGGFSQTTFCGNLLGHMVKHPCFNSDQHLVLEGRTVTYLGQRNPMVQDGALETLREIAGGDVQTLHVTEYETSVKDMRWWENLEDWLKRQPLAVQLDELAREVERVKSGERYAPPLAYTWGTDIKDAAERFNALPFGIAYRRYGREGSRAAHLAQYL